MAWKTINGHRYYRRSRKVGGRVITEHIGKGPEAEFVAAVDAERRREREAEREERRRRREVDRELDRSVIETRDLAAAMLRAGGYHQHKGEWRKRKMSGELATRETTPPVPTLPSRRREFRRLVDDAVLRFAVESKVEAEKDIKGKVIREIRDRAAELAGPDPTPAEVMAAETAALAWLALRVAERDELAALTVQQAVFTSKRVDHATRRLLSALRTLAMLRKLNRPSVQVNIAQQQNIAGF